MTLFPFASGGKTMINHDQPLDFPMFWEVYPRTSTD